MFSQLEIGVHHFFHQLFEPHLRLPTELLLGFDRIADQVIGKATVARHFDIAHAKALGFVEQRQGIARPVHHHQRRGQPGLGRPRTGLKLVGAGEEADRRLLADPRSDRFIHSFADQWLDLRRVTETTPPAPRRDPRVIAAIVASALFMQNLDSSVVATALPAMARDLGQDPVHLSVAITSYLVALCVFIPVSGWVADRFGPRRVFMVAIVVFAAASEAFSQKNINCSISDSLQRFGAGAAPDFRFSTKE